MPMWRGDCKTAVEFDSKFSQIAFDQKWGYGTVHVANPIKYFSCAKATSTI